MIVSETKQITLSRAKCGCKMLDSADPVTFSTIAECKTHRVKREKYTREKTK